MSSRIPQAVVNARTLYRAALVVGSSVIVLYLLWPFIPALTGVGLLWMSTRRPYTFLLLHTRNRTLTALLGVVAVTLCIVVPAAFAVNWIAANTLEAFGVFRSGAFWDALQGAVNALNSLAVRHGFGAVNADVPGTLQRLLNLSSSFLLSLLTGSIGALTQIVVMLFLLFFWYRDGYRIRQRTSRLVPYNRHELRFLVRRVQNTVKGAVFGTLVVSVIQGVLAWAVFWMLRLPGAVFLGSLTGVCAVFPAVGAYFVWLPLVLYLLMLHAWTRAIILLVIGIVLLSTIDNVLLPVIARSRTRMETVPMFLSFFGGVWAFGVSGLILGPILWSLTGSLIAIGLTPDRGSNQPDDLKRVGPMMRPGCAETTRR